MPTFQLQSRIELSPEDLFEWHCREGCFQRLGPPWQEVEPIELANEIANGSRSEFNVQAGPFRRRWIAEHFDVARPSMFRDRQIRGPFVSWLHTHKMLPDGENASILDDCIEYRLPLGFVGALLAGRWMNNQLDRAFRYRHRVTSTDLLNHQRYQGQSMKVLISGSTGLIGSQLVSYLSGAGHDVFRLVRRPSEDPKCIQWDPSSQTIDRDLLNGIDAVVHLGGENIAGGRWTKKRKARIRSSRVEGTSFLAKTLAELDSPPKSLLAASAIGFYGDRADEDLDEDSDLGDIFLCDVCKEWEDATKPASDAGVRVANLRIGVVLTPAGGALHKMLTPFLCGGGGIVGNGKQYWSWIAIDDVLAAVEHVLNTESLSGPVNLVSPQSSTNYEFTKTLGRVLRRPTIFPLPAFVARTMLGQMADELLLASAKVYPTRLSDSGFQFHYPELESALRHVLGR